VGARPVVVKYTLIDEYLSVIIVNYYFPKLTIGHYGKLWRTKKFRLFNYYVLDELYLPKKKDLVNAIRPLPAGIGGRIMKINDVRNAVAHSFFPQNRRRYRKQGGLLCDGADLFTYSSSHYDMSLTRLVVTARPCCSVTYASATSPRIQGGVVRPLLPGRGVIISRVTLPPTVTPSLTSAKFSILNSAESSTHHALIGTGRRPPFRDKSSVSSTPSA
jgi:hypothetical protein